MERKTGALLMAALMGVAAWACAGGLAGPGGDVWAFIFGGMTLAFVFLAISGEAGAPGDVHQEVHVHNHGHPHGMQQQPLYIPVHHPAPPPEVVYVDRYLPAPPPQYAQQPQPHYLPQPQLHVYLSPPQQPAALGYQHQPEAQYRGHIVDVQAEPVPPYAFPYGGQPPQIRRGAVAQLESPQASLARRIARRLVG